jgi:hypothetical protein
MTYQRARRAGDSGYSGFSSNLYQATLGNDLYLQNGAQAGLGVSLSSSLVFNDMGRATVEQGSIFAYGKTQFQDYVLDGIASYGVSSSNLNRSDSVSGNSWGANNVMGYDALVSVGLSRYIGLSDDHSFISPYARVTLQTVSQSPFEEATSSESALAVRGYTGTGTRSTLGILFGSERKDSMLADYTYKVNLAVGMDNNYLINPKLLATQDGFNTVIRTTSVGNVFVQGSVYGTVKLSDNIYAFANVALETRSNQTLFGASAGMRLLL